MTKAFDVKGNFFGAVIYGEGGADRAQRVATIARELTYSRDPETNQEYLDDLRRFNEYLKSEYKRIGQDLRDFVDSHPAKSEDPPAAAGNSVPPSHIDELIKANDAMKSVYGILEEASSIALLASSNRGIKIAYSILDDAIVRAVMENKHKRLQAVGPEAKEIGKYIGRLIDCAREVMEGDANVSKQAIYIQAGEADPEQAAPVSLVLSHEVQDAITALNDTSAEKKKPARTRPAVGPRA